MSKDYHAFSMLPCWRNMHRTSNLPTSFPGQGEAMKGTTLTTALLLSVPLPCICLQERRTEEGIDLTDLEM